jgi:AraC-like DNA-binding protein
MNNRLKQIGDWKPLARQAKWSVKGMALLCGVSVSTLNRHFRENHHQTAETWLAEQRWQDTLASVQMGIRVNDIARDAGYAHLSTFSREFKKRFGQSPSAWGDLASDQPQNRQNDALS